MDALTIPGVPRDVEALLALAVEQAQDAVLVTDRAGRIRYVNAAFERLTGYPRDEIVGQSPSVLRAEHTDRDAYRGMWETVSAGRTWSGTWVNRRRDGSYYSESNTITPLVSPSGEISAFVAFKRDVTHSVALEQQLRRSQRLESVGRLAGGIAHDFNNVLGVIRGHIEEAAERARQGQPDVTGLHEALRGVERASDLARRLLAFGRKQPAAPRVLDLTEVVSDTGRMLGRLVGDDVRICMELHEQPVWVHVDRTQFEQVLVNLVVNARDAMPTGGRITVSVTQICVDEAFSKRLLCTHPGEYALLSVTDEGTGIPEDVLPHVFEPFFTTKGPDRGSGLGLSVVYGIVKQANGYLWIESRPGRGTSVYVYLPLVLDAAGAQEDTPPTVTEPPSHAGHATVLVVEDEEDLRALALRLVSRLGYRALAAASAEEALEVVAGLDHPPDVLFSDLVLPGQGGASLALALRRSTPGLGVVLASGYDAEQGGLDAAALPGAVFLPKPYSGAHVGHALSQVLETASRRQAP